VPERFGIRTAQPRDIPALQDLIPRSVRTLQAAYYSADQIEAALGPVFGVDTQLIRDGTYFVVEETGRLVGSGGWSYREAVFGGDRAKASSQTKLVPGKDPARIRAFFVDPSRARCGIGRLILRTCETAIIAAGFRDAILVATLAGEPLYLSCGYAVDRRYEVPLRDDGALPVVAMSKHLG
jgi:GNAT superfamily N-acetyltransferase